MIVKFGWGGIRDHVGSLVLELASTEAIEFVYDRDADDTLLRCLILSSGGTTVDTTSNRSSLTVPLEVLRVLLSPIDIPESILGLRPLSITLFLALIPTRFTSSFIASLSDIIRLGAVLRRTVEGRVKGVAVGFPLTGVTNVLPVFPRGVAGTIK